MVITMLPNGPWSGVLRRGDGQGPQGALFVDSSTIAVDDAREVHAYAGERGFAQLDAPVSGGVKGAVAGTLAFMVGGAGRAQQRAAAGAGTHGGQDHSLR